VVRLCDGGSQDISRSSELTHKDAPRRRKLNAMGVAFEQGDADAILQISYAATYGGLLDFQLLRGPAEAGRLGDAEQGAQFQ
jgi:hypothetical protein